MHKRPRGENSTIALVAVRLFVFVTLLGLNGNLLAAGQAGVNHYWVFCESDPEQPEVYFSDVFDVATKIQGRAADVAVSRQVEPAFISFLKQKYSSKSGASCTTGGREQSGAAEDRAKAYIKSQNKKIIETGWKYTAE